LKQFSESPRIGIWNTGAEYRTSGSQEQAIRYMRLGRTHRFAEQGEGHRQEADRRDEAQDLQTGRLKDGLSLKHPDELHRHRAAVFA